MILTERAPGQLLKARACIVAGAAKSAAPATKSLRCIPASLFSDKKPCGSG
jgi:hypothetical protein